MSDRTILARLTAELVSSYVGSRSLSDVELESAMERLPALIGRVHEALLKIIIETPEVELTESEESSVIRLAPKASRLAPPAETVFDDHLICLEDGQSFRTLKRHLAVHHGLSPEQYRKKWSLPDNYPMAAPAYAASRAAIAKNIGLGANGRGGKPEVMNGRQTKSRAGGKSSRAVAPSRSKQRATSR